MNCYYSNLIEGHATHPIDIERALKNDFSQDAHKRDLQIEAKAHIAVQEWIDGGGLKSGRALKTEGIREIHRRFCSLLPEDLLWAEDPVTGQRVRLVPGQLRERDVKVGQLIAVSPGALPRFLATLRTSLRWSRQDRVHYLHRGCSPPAVVDPSVPGWQRSSGAADVPCNATGNSGHGSSLVCRTRLGAQCGRVQGASRRLRPPAPQRSGRTRRVKRGSSR